MMVVSFLSSSSFLFLSLRVVFAFLKFCFVTLMHEEERWRSPVIQRYNLHESALMTTGNGVKRDGLDGAAATQMLD